MQQGIMLDWRLGAFILRNAYLDIKGTDIKNFPSYKNFPVLHKIYSIPKDIMRYLLILVNGILIGAFDRAKFAANTLPR